MSRRVQSLLTSLILVGTFGCLSDDTPSGPTAEGKVVVTIESTAATTQTIGPAGGTIQATGSNGITYTLVIPENALLRDTAITLTPVREIQNLPLSGGLVAAVDFKPSGLSFVNPATLTIATSARPTGNLKMVGLSYAGDGDSLGLALIDVGASDVKFTVTHFSGLGLAFGTTQNVQALLQSNPATTNSSQFYINTLFAALLQSPRDAAFELQVMEDWFDNVVLLALRNATTDAQLVTAFSELSEWNAARPSLNSLISPTPTLDSRDTQWSKQELGPKIGQAIAGNLQLCATQGTITSARIAALDNAIFWLVAGAAYGAGPAGSFPDDAAFPSVSCAQVVTVSVVPPPNPMQIGFPHSLDITFGLKFVNDPTPVPASFEVTVFANNATVGTPQGFTALSPRGFFTTVVTAESSSVFLAVTACYSPVLIGGNALCHTETIFAGASPPPPPGPPPPAVGDKYVGTRQFNGTSNPFDAALIFTPARDRALFCTSPFSGNTPDQNRRTCATLGGPFTDKSNYILFSITFSGNTFHGTDVFPGGTNFGLRISGQINGTQLSGRYDDTRNGLFVTFTMTQR